MSKISDRSLHLTIIVNAMQKYLGLTVALILLMPEITLSQPLPPVTQTSTINQPVCYMQTADGKILDLSKLCIQMPVKSETPQNQKSIQRHNH